MLVQLESMPGAAKIWCYTLSRELTEQEFKAIDLILVDFLDQWASHGKGLAASRQWIGTGQGLVIAVNEEIATASGCSIDACVHILKELGQQYSLDFFNRMKVLINDENAFHVTDIQGLKQGFADGKYHENTQVWNQLAPTLGIYRNNPFLPLQQSWAMRFISSKAKV